MYLPHLTAGEVDALDRDLPVVASFAAIEQHGPHLPTGTDALITEGILRRLESRRGSDFLWLPVQVFGSSSHHMPFGATVTLSSRTFLDVARELVESVAAYGFRRFLLLNGHGGNQSLLNVAVQEIRLGVDRVVADATRRELKLVHATYWVVAAEAFAAIRESPPGGMGHAGEMETSVMMALHPDLVRTDRLAPDRLPPRSALEDEDMLRPGRVGQFRFWDELSRGGVLGDPSQASAEKGNRFLDAAAAGIERVLDDLRADRLG